MIKRIFTTFLVTLALALAAAPDFSVRNARPVFEKTLQGTLDFWTSAQVVDPRGGYHLWFDADGKQCAPAVPNRPNIPDAAKPILSELRVLYAHAMAIPRAKSDSERDRLRKQYEHGFDFIAKYLDPASGLYIKMLDEDGKPFNTELTAVTQTYVIYIMSEIALEICDRRAFDIAQRTFEKFDAAYHDPKHGGYFETAARDIKSVGSNLHAALAYARLLELNPSGPVRERLQELFAILTSDKVLHPGTGNGYMTMTADWQPVPNNKPADQQVLYGHNAELIWYLLEAARMLRIHPDTMKPWLEKVSRPIIRYGIFPDGKAAIFGPFEGAPQPVNTPRWWTQVELMNMLVKLYEVTGNEEYYRLFEKVCTFTWAHLVRPDGVFYGAVDLDTGKKYYLGGWAWKSSLHVVRAMKLIDRSLANLENGWKPERKHKSAADLPKRAIQVSLGYPYNHDRSAASLVSEIKAQGYDAIFIIIKENQIRPAGLVEEAKKQGLQVWGSFFGPGTFMPDSLFPPESKEWRMEFTVKRGNRYFSYVHPEYRAWWKRYLANFYDNHQLDGFVFYESHYGTRMGILAGKSEPWFGDVSPGFRREFRKQTGRANFPNFTDPKSPDYYQTNRELYQDYVEYRVKSINDFYGEIWDGKGGLRRNHPEVTYGTWTIALDAPGAIEEMREGEAQDGPRMVSGLAPDFHFIQSHWPDWIPEKQKPQYILGYKPYMKAILDAFPGLPLAIQGDFASTVPYRRSPAWVAEFDKVAKETGFEFTTYYEFQVRYQIYFDAPKTVSGELNADGSGKVVFDQRIAKESAAKLVGRSVGTRKIKRVSTDGNWLLFQLDAPVKPGETLTVSLAGITDDPAIRVPMPKLKQGRLNPVPANTQITLKAK